MNKNELWNLRMEIILCSLFYNDYINSYDYDTHIVCDFFDGYADKLEYLMLKDGFTDDDYFDQLNNYDNIDTLWNYYCSLEFNPFINVSRKTKE